MDKIPVGCLSFVFGILLFWGLFELAAINGAFTLGEREFVLSVPIFAEKNHQIEIPENFVQRYVVSSYWSSGIFHIKIPDKDNCLDTTKTSGTSMLPASEEGSISLVDFCFPVEELEIGDVIVFDKEKSFGRVQHRVVEINLEEEWIITKGDNNNRSDKKIPFKQYMAKVLATFNTQNDYVKKERVEKQ